MTDPKESKNRKPSNRINNLTKFAGIPFKMIAIIGVGTFAGIKLDEAYPNQHSLYTIICSFSSVIIAMYVVIKQVTDDTKKNSGK